jgi:tetratricopeptide (TPR) repeat protein
MNSFEPEPLLPVSLPLDDHPGPAPRIVRERALAMVEAALLDFQSAQPIAAQRRYTLGRTLAIAASVLLALAGGAAAARYYFDFGHDQRSLPQQVEPAAQVEPHAVAAPAPATEPAPVEPPNLETAPPPAASKANRALDRAAPEDLLQKANHLRAEGQFREAAHTYGLVYERFPRSLSAYVARVAAGAIELEHLSNPTRARRLFEQALREQPKGALDLEARQGLSVALRDLEDQQAEVRTLQALVGAHPDSPAARRAQVRLRELGVAER